MVKKIISFLFLCSFLLLFSLIPCDVFADDVLDVCPNCGERTYSTWRDVSISVSEALGLPFSIKAKSCSKCHYQYYDWNLFGFADYHDYVGDESLIINYLRQWADKILGKDASASKFEAGGGSASPGGVGRNPSGYAGEGVPNYSSDGELQLVVYPQIQNFNFSEKNLNGYKDSFEFSYDIYLATYSNYTYTVKSLSNSTYQVPLIFHNDSSQYVSTHLVYRIPSVPVDGNYYFSFNNVRLSSDYPLAYGSNQPTYIKYSGSFNKHLSVSGDPVTVLSLTSADKVQLEAFSSVSVKYYPIVINVIPDTVNVTNKPNITINNNTWNGNIYIDNSNKLTYIYPQYTVNNETKISNNPIIYNEETKQYYTYDQTTNNYYYITYNAPTPTPTPSPSPDPGGTTPDPDKPSPTPTPGGSGGGDAPSGGGSNWWDKLLDDIFSGFLEGVKGILKLLFDLFSSILGWIIWLCSKVFDLFPFLPPGVGALLVGGVVVCFILAFIKFIRG